MKKLKVLFVCIFMIQTVFAQLVTRKEISSHYMIESSMDRFYRYVDSDYGLCSSFLKMNHKMLSVKWMEARGKHYKVKPYLISKGKSKELKKIKQENKDCFHQIVSDGIIISYYIKTTEDNFEISFDERNVKDYSLIREVQVRTIPKNNKHLKKDKCRYKVITASSLNNKYFVVVFDKRSTFGFKNYNFSSGKIVLRIDATKHSDELLKYQESVNSNSNLYAIKDTKVIVGNDGNVALVDQMLSIDQKMEDSIEFYDENDSQKRSDLYRLFLANCYYKLSCFPLNSAGYVVKKSFSNILPNSFDIKYTKDNRVLLYGFASKSLSGYANTFFTTFFDPEIELFTAAKTAKVNGVDNDIASIDIDNLGHIPTSDMDLLPLDMVELENGSFVAFANFHVSMDVQVGDFIDRSDMYVNLLYFILDNDGTLRSQGIDFCCFPKTELSRYIHSAARPYVKTDGEHALVFMPVMTTGLDLDYSIRYVPNLVLKVISIDSNNKIKSQVLGEKANWMFSTFFIYGDPYYDEVSENWWLYVRNYKKCFLERWKINS